MSDGDGHSMVPSSTLRSLWHTPGGGHPDQHLVGEGTAHLDVVAELCALSCVDDAAHRRLLAPVFPNAPRRWQAEAGDAA